MPHAGPKRSIAEQFENALISTTRSLRLNDPEPTSAPLRKLLDLLGKTHGGDEAQAVVARSILRDLHHVHEYVRLHDDNWSNPKKPKREYKLRREHVPERLHYVYELASELWPLLPFVKLLVRTRASKAWTATKSSARLHEHVFTMLCTQPGAMRAWLYALADDVVARELRLRYRWAHHVDRAPVVDTIVASLENRPAPVGRYRASANTVDQAAKRVRIYMTGAIKRRLPDALHQVLIPELPPSTARRYRKQGHKISSPGHVDVIRREMRERQTHVPAGRISLAGLARKLQRGRSSTAKALAKAQTLHHFVAERGPDGTILLTPAQARWVMECMPTPRRHSAR